MPSTSRFESASSSLTLRGLLRKTKRVFWISAAVGIAAHLSLTEIAGVQAEQKVSKPLTTQFVKRAPRLTKPLELKKRPQPKRRQVQREMVAVEARASRQQASSWTKPVEVVKSLARPEADMGRSVSLAQGGREPCVLAAQLEGTKDAKEIVDMSLEMVDVEALDTGQYQAMVIQDPSDKRAVRGFFHLILTYSANLRATSYSQTPRLQAEMWGGIRRMVERLKDATAIRADVWGRKYTYDASEMLEVPWVYARMLSPSFTVPERENIGRYMAGGGFFMLTVGTDFGPDKNGFREIELSLSSAGYRPRADWDFERLPNSHLLYHCYYDFSDGPPHGFDLLYADTRPATVPVDYIEGVHLGNHLACVLEYQMFAMTWYYYGHFAEGSHLNPERLFQFGINTVIFALTQEGSITRRLMDGVR